MSAQGLMDFDVEVSAVLLAHRFTMEPGVEVDTYRHGRHMHGMVCALRGGGEYVFADGARVLVAPGQVALIPAAACYRVHAADGAPFAHYTVNFLGDAKTFPAWIPPEKAHVLRPRDPEMYRSRFEELTEIWLRMRSGYRMQARARLLQLLGDYLAESQARRVDPGAYSRTLPAKRMIEERYAEPITLAQLAKACGMCEGSFRRAFAAVYNQSPVAYLLNLRVERAKEMLLIGLSLEDAAQRTGFSDVNYFIRYFRKVTGTTPGRFRQMY